MKKLSKNNQAILAAISKGYKVDDDGKPYGPDGNPLTVFCPNRDRKWKYYHFSVAKHNNIGIHRMQAYRKFGDAMFEDGVCVRHLDGNCLNNHIDNIAIGTQSDNMMDREPANRREHALKATEKVRKMSADTLMEIKNKRAGGATYKELQEEYGIAKATLSYWLSKSGKSVAKKDTLFYKEALTQPSATAAPA